MTLGIKKILESYSGMVRGSEQVRNLWRTGYREDLRLVGRLVGSP